MSHPAADQIKMTLVREELVSLLAVIAVGEGGPLADRVTERLSNSLPGYLEAIVKHQVTVDAQRAAKS